MPFVAVPAKETIAERWIGEIEPPGALGRIHMLNLPFRLPAGAPGSIFGRRSSWYSYGKGSQKTGRIDARSFVPST